MTRTVAGAAAALAALSACGSDTDEATEFGERLERAMNDFDRKTMEPLLCSAVAKKIDWSERGNDKGAAEFVSAAVDGDRGMVTFRKTAGNGPETMAFPIQREGGRWVSCLNFPAT